METKMKKLVYDGVNEVMNGKIAFMEQCMSYRATQEMMADRISQDAKLREKLNCATTDAVRKKIYHQMLSGEEFGLLYDAIYEKRIIQFMENTKNPQMWRYVLPMQLDGTRMELDITYFIVYGIMSHPCCRETFHREADRLGELCEYYERSDYKNKYFEKCFQTEDIWDARALVGLLEKMRQEEEDGEAYQFLMKVIYAGYGYIKRQMKDRDCITGRWMKEVLQDDASASYNMMAVAGKIFILLAIAEDLRIPYVWDYEMLTLFRSFQEFQEEMECGILEHSGLPFLENADHIGFLQKVDEKYGSHDSLFDLLQQEREDAMGELLVRVMSLYEVNPRKFWNDKLSGQEVERLLQQSETWSMKNYRYMLVVAQLCKYIQKLENAYLRSSEEQTIWHIHSNNIPNGIKGQDVQIRCRK